MPVGMEVEEHAGEQRNEAAVGQGIRPRNRSKRATAPRLRRTKLLGVETHPLVRFPLRGRLSLRQASAAVVHLCEDVQHVVPGSQHAARGADQATTDIEAAGSRFAAAPDVHVCMCVYMCLRIRMCS